MGETLVRGSIPPPNHPPPRKRYQQQEIHEATDSGDETDKE